MHRLLRFLFIATLLGPLAGLDPAAAMTGADCRQAALAELQAASPDGFAIYGQISQPDFFVGWLRCDDAQFDLSTAVHESTHFITSETDAFPLVGGGAVARPHAVSAFFPPYRIARRFETDGFVSIYLRRGRASSSTDFLYLLDELNAYSHDLETAVDLKDLQKNDEAVDHRDGLAAMMAFVAVYAEAAKAGMAGREAQTWSGLHEPQVAATIADLWSRAERVMASSCGIPNFGRADTSYIRQVCAAPARSALASILGRAPVCPTACLQPGTDVEAAQGADAATEPAARFARRLAAGRP